MDASERPLRILHVLRAPVGGLFRHVLDLAAAQAERGHRVGILADSITGGARGAEQLARIAPEMALGVKRIPMNRLPSPLDIPAIWKASAHARAVKADIIHGHGAKGGLYARLARGGAATAYTPHGGSLNFNRNTPAGFLYLSCESALRAFTDISLFESAYARNVYEAKIGRPHGVQRIVHNGIAPAEFTPVEPAADATDLIFIGEMAVRKGVDILFQALNRLNARNVRLTLTAVGSGPEEEALKLLSQELGLSGQITFRPPMNARQAFALGRVLVVPSRAESLPYIVLEGLAAGRPMVATNVGGMPEIFGPHTDSLVPAGDVEALAAAISKDPGALAAQTADLRDFVKRGFSISAMCDGIMDAYRAGLDLRHSA
ncbi:glycosyltransferase [Bosea sp. 117]|uniref:glycosyltransferase n=1 Tax=Bosea sp. 117 TaxID=1125973 RepID=UPI000493E94C|nr:glycosyltransferase [Bosea sp. 117]